MNEYKLKWLRFIWETSFTFFLFWILFKIIMIILNFLMVTQGTERLIWIVILGMFVFSYKFRIPEFYRFYRELEVTE